MNMSYMYANGNIHIFDENHNKRVVEYKDGIKEMLILENKINLCEKFILENEECIDELSGIFSNDFFTNIAMTASYGVTGYALPMAIDYFCKLDLGSMDINIKTLSFVTAIIGLCIGVRKSIKDYKSKRVEFKELYSRLECRDKFTNLYNRYKQIYDDLSFFNTKNQESIYKEKQFEIIDLNYEQSYKEVQDYFVRNILFEAYRGKFIDDYEQGSLKSKLQNIDPKDFETIENMIKEEVSENKKGKQYVKTK